MAAIGDRMEQVGLRLHPDKTRIVYCQDGNRPTRLWAHGVYVPGVHFSARAARARSRNDVRLVPARDQQGRPEQDQRSDPPMAAAPLDRAHLAEIARQINPVVRGWMQYYGAFYRSALNPLLSRINAYLMRWIRNKYKRLRTTKKAAGMLAAHHPPISPALRPLGMGARFLVDRMTRAR